MPTAQCTVSKMRNVQVFFAALLNILAPSVLLVIFRAQYACRIYYSSPFSSAKNHMKIRTRKILIVKCSYMSPQKQALQLLTLFASIDLREANGVCVRCMRIECTRAASHSNVCVIVCDELVADSAWGGLAGGSTTGTLLVRCALHMKYDIIEGLLLSNAQVVCRLHVCSPFELSNAEQEKCVKYEYETQKHHRFTQLGERKEKRRWREFRTKLYNMLKNLLTEQRNAYVTCRLLIMRAHLLMISGPSMQIRTLFCVAWVWVMRMLCLASQCNVFLKSSNMCIKYILESV